MKSSGGIFNQRPALDIDYNITAIDAFQNLLFTGDEKGNIYRYNISPDDIQIIQASSMLSKQITKSKIESIKFLPNANGNILVLSDSSIHLIDISQGGIKVDTLKEYGKKIVIFTVNEFSKTHANEIIVITKSKEGIILQYNQKTNKFDQQEEKFSLPDIPQCAAFIGSNIYFGISKKGYFMINLEDKQYSVIPVSHIEIGSQPFIKGIDIDEKLFISTSNLGIFIGKDLQIKQKSTVNIQNKQFTTITIFKPYLIVLFENLIQIFNVSDAKFMGDLQLSSQSAKCITSSSNKLFYANAKEIVYLFLTPPDLQIKEFLAKAKVEEAISVFQQHFPPGDPNRAQQLDQLKLDCAWSLIKILQFDEALKYMTSTNFEPRDIVCLFPEYFPQQKKFFSINENQSKFTLKAIIQTFVNDPNIKKTGDSAQKIAQYENQAKEFLIDVLDRRRGVLISPAHAYTLKERVILLSSTHCFNQNQWGNLTGEEILELIDFALIKAQIDICTFDRLKLFLSSGQIYCKALYPDLQAYIIQNQQNIKSNQPFLLPSFYESFNQIDIALDSLKSIGDTSQWEEACKQTIRILKKNSEKTRIFKYFGWVIKKSQEIGTSLFSELKEQSVTPDQMLEYLSKLDLDEEQRRKLKEKYLEEMVLKQNIEEERFHTQLANSYIDAIFQVIPKNTDFNNIDQQKLLQINEMYNKLKQYLKTPNAKYNSSSILEQKVKDSWMVPEIIQLYGRERRHDEALTKLINLNQFSWAERYCCEQNDMLLTKLFKKYIDFYNQLSAKIVQQQDQNSLNNLRGLKETINNFLKKYSTHSQLSPSEVLEIIPERWMLEEFGLEDGLFCFLNSVISFTLHKKRFIKAAKHIADQELLNIECQFAQAKKAHIKINTERKCAVCQRSIGDKVFVVYPNAVVAHHTCIKSNTVCPLTEKDFEKYFKF